MFRKLLKESLFLENYVSCKLPRDGKKRKWGAEREGGIEGRQVAEYEIFIALSGFMGEIRSQRSGERLGDPGKT